MRLISPALHKQYTQLVDTADAVIHRHAQPTMSDELAQLSKSVSVSEKRDSYGQGGVVSAFEQELCTLFDKPGCLFLPTGTLAQCAALKCYAERTGKAGVGLHPTSHLLLHEHMAITSLWGMSAVTLGQAQQVMTEKDVQQLDPDTTAALVIETPMREIGGAMPSWQTLCNIRQWCDTHHIGMHLDGARLWQTTAFYQRSLADIAALFDSLYVSFYKDLGSIFGAALLGSPALIDGARVWARRAGGNPITLYPEVVAAREGMRTYLPRMAEFVAYTASLCELFHKVPATLIPEQPKAAMFHLSLPMDADTLAKKIVRYAEQTGVIALPLPRSGDSHHCICEISVGDQATAQPPDFWIRHINACLEA